MTYAQAANAETCAAPGCHAPVELDVTHTVDTEHSVDVGYCLPHAFDVSPSTAAAQPAAEAPEAPATSRRRWRR